MDAANKPKNITEEAVETYLKQVRGQQLSGYHADTPITIKDEASSKADSCPN